MNIKLQHTKLRFDEFARADANRESDYQTVPPALISAINRTVASMQCTNLYKKRYNCQKNRIFNKK